MNRLHGVAFAFLCFTVFGAAPAGAASVTQVDRSTWGANGVPNYVSMYIYVPDQLAAKPPVVVGCHSCGTPVSGYQNSINGIKAAADRNGFIIILPEATGRNCWDVGSTQGLTRDGGGDAHAIIQMVNYVLSEYDGDSERVYVLGGSSGAMMTQALAALYPDVFKAASARAGVPAGCWADGYDPSNQWGGNCSNGNTRKTAQEWGDLVRNMNPGYTGPRPRVQLFHGTADATISYNNMGEAIKEWTNVLGLSDTPTSEDTTTTPVSTYDRDYWTNDCGVTVLEAWHGRNGAHSMAYEEDAILDFFGLDEAGRADPEATCGGDVEPIGEGGAGGEPSSGGAQNAGGSGPAAGGAGTTPGEEPGTPGAGGDVGEPPVAPTASTPPTPTGNPVVPTATTPTATTPTVTTPTATTSTTPNASGPPAPTTSPTASPTAPSNTDGTGGTPGTTSELVDASSDGGSTGGCAIGGVSSKRTPLAALAWGLALFALHRRARLAQRRGSRFLLS